MAMASNPSISIFPVMGNAVIGKDRRECRAGDLHFFFPAAYRAQFRVKAG